MVLSLAPLALRLLDAVLVSEGVGFSGEGMAGVYGDEVATHVCA